MKKLLLLSAALLGAAAMPSPGSAADYPIYTKERRAITFAPDAAICGRCGCPIVTTVRHPTIRMAYPASFDPRERDDPNYYIGRTRSFKRYERSFGSAACTY